MSISEKIAEFARLDQVGSFIVPRLKRDVADAFIAEVRRRGSIDAMDEPFRSWCRNPNMVPDEFLETPTSSGESVD